MVRRRLLALGRAVAEGGRGGRRIERGRRVDRGLRNGGGRRLEEGLGRLLVIEILRAGDWGANVRLFEHGHNQGKGAAIRTALGEARGEFAAIFDADLEYDPADLGVLMPPLLEGKTNACFGVRVFDGYTSHSFMFVMGNKGVTLACNVLFNVYLHDIMTCHKMIRTELFRRLDLESNGFAIEPEITARLVQHHEKIFEVPVHYRARSSDEGKKLTARDGFRVIGTLLKLRLQGG